MGLLQEKIMMERNCSPRRTRSSNRLANQRTGAGLELGSANIELRLRHKTVESTSSSTGRDVEDVGHEEIMAENEENYSSVTVGVAVDDTDASSPNDTIELDDTEDLSVIDLTEEYTAPDRYLIPVSPMRLGSNYKSIVRKFLRDCPFEQLPASEVEKVTFRNIRNLWDEKVGKSLYRSEKQVLKDLSINLLRRLLVDQLLLTSSAVTVDLTDSPVKNRPEQDGGLGLKCP